jgi:hypothetical protein
MYGGYGQPGGAPVRKSGGSGCLVWGLGGCGALVVLAVLFSAFGLWQVSRNPGWKKMLSNATATQRCGPNLVTIRSALQAYQKAHAGHYPPTLETLTPQYLPDNSTLACTKSDGEALKAEYTPPKPNAPADASVVSFCGSDATVMSFQSTSVSQRVCVRLLKDGHIVSDQIQRTVLPDSRLPSSSGEDSSQ